MFKIGNITIKTRVALSPMAGVSNPAYIKICEELGCGFAVTELLSSEAIIRENKKTFEMLNGLNEINMPVGVQLFGSNPDTIALAARYIYRDFSCSFIDINMGCPVPKVAVKSNAGASLLRNPEKVREIVEKVVKAVPVPVTVKIRIGWDEKSINAVEIAKICESAGASAICIHGRTRSQGYSGKVNYDCIAEVKKSVKIPVIGNGDIVDIESLNKMLSTGVDAVMIGRGALGNPWLLKKIITFMETGEILPDATYEEKIDMCLKHLEYLTKYKNEHLAMLEIRSHIAWYLKGLKNSKEIKEKIFLVTNIHDIINILEEYKDYLRKEENYEKSLFST